MTTQKIIEETNAITWFEIPVLDMARAKKFYESILNIEMKGQYAEETKEEIMFFPFTPAGTPRASSGRVSGVLVKNDLIKPSDSGTTVYLNCNPSIQKVLERIQPAGGKVITPKTKIISGYFAIFIDTEGNRVGLYAIE